MARSSTGFKDVHGREICDGDIVEYEAIRDRVVFRGGNWTTEHSAENQSLALLIPLEVVARPGRDKGTRQRGTAA